VLDLGCGTGGHSLSLASRGYEVTGVDASPVMVAAASKKARQRDLPVRFIVARLEALDLGERFDAVVCMFNVIDYVVGDKGLQKTFGNVRRHLAPGGLFLFDFRNGVPAIRSYEATRVKWVHANKPKILRISETELDPIGQLFHTTYKCLIFHEGCLVKEFEDDHLVHFYFLPEIRYYLGQAGFEAEHVCKFPEIDSPPTEEDWNIAVIARNSDR